MNSRIRNNYNLQQKQNPSSFLQSNRHAFGRILKEGCFILSYIMLQAKEENRCSKVLEAYINQNITSESHSSTIHSAIAKGRLSFGPSHHCPDSKRRVIRIRQSSKQELPVLGQRVQREQSTRRMYQSVIIGDSTVKEPQIKRVKLSQLTNYQPIEPKTMKIRIATAPTQKKAVIKSSGSEYVPRKKKKAGYEGQKERLQQNQNKISYFLSNYERVEAATKLKDVMVDLKEEVIRTNSRKFGLLKNE